MVCVKSEGINPSSTSLSLNCSRTHKPSARGRDVNVFLINDSESPNSRTKYTPLISRKSIAITVPEVFSTSTLPSLTSCVGDRYPETESRSIFRTITFLCVEGMERQRSVNGGLWIEGMVFPSSHFPLPSSHCSLPSDSRIFPRQTCGIRLGSSQNINLVL